MRANEQNTHVFRRTQTLVGLMCWFAAKETRSPFLARFASSANPPIVRRSHELNSARPSSRVRRSLRATFSAIGARARSRAVTDVGDYGLRISDCGLEGPRSESAIRNPQSAISCRPSDRERDVVAAAPGRVRQRELDRALHGLVGRRVEIAGRIRRELVDGGVDDTGLGDECGKCWLGRAALPGEE